MHNIYLLVNILWILLTMYVDVPCIPVDQPSSVSGLKVMAKRSLFYKKHFTKKWLHIKKWLSGYNLWTRNQSKALKTHIIAYFPIKTWSKNWLLAPKVWWLWPKMCKLTHIVMSSTKKQIQNFPIILSKVEDFLQL